MAGTLTIPNIIGQQSGPRVAASLFDQNWNAIRDYVNARQVTFGLLAARPAAGVAGRYFFATDIGAEYIDNGTTWVSTSSGGTINVAAFGVAPGASASVNRANLQAAIDALPAEGGAIQFTQYGIRIDAQISVTKPLMVLGPGTTEVTTPGTFVLYLDTVGQTGFAVTGKGPFTLQNFSVRGTTNTRAVLIDGPTGALEGTESCRIDNVVFLDGATHVEVADGIFPTLTRSLFWNYTSFGVHVHNTLNVDQGDTAIDLCTFNGGSVGANGVFWTAGGGLRITSSKFFHGAYGIQLDVLGTTVDVIIDDVSIENFVDGGILVSRSSGAATLSHLTIAETQIAQYSGAGSGIIINPVTPGSFIVALNITGCTINNITGDAIVLREVNGGMILGNHLDAGSAAFNGDATVENVYVGPNNYYSTPSLLTGSVGTGTILQGGTIGGSGGIPVAMLPAFANGSQAYASDALGPGDGGYTGYGMTATGGGAGAPAFRNFNTWKV